jgi:3-vinyl bacteriochlorophyllide hydratase
VERRTAVSLASSFSPPCAEAFVTPRTHGEREQHHGGAPARRPLYTPAERARRDATRWTLVQGVLAPLQVAVMLASVALVLRYLITGEGLWAANASVVAKTLVLYAIMITGALWEKEVFGQYLFAPAFFWEDVVSFVVIAIHTLYLAGLLGGFLGPRTLMYTALVAYAVYAVNAAQFVAKLRAARRDEAAARAAGASPVGAPAGAAA